MNSRFLALPAELRIPIYTLVLDYPDLANSYEKARSKLDDAFKDRERPEVPLCTLSPDYTGAFVTPPILLLNRQITSEALPVLWAKTLHVPSPPPHAIYLQGNVDIAQFISDITLQKAQKVTLTVNPETHGYRDWRRMVENLLAVWGQEENSLKSLHVKIINGSASMANQKAEAVLAGVSSSALHLS